MDLLYLRACKTSTRLINKSFLRVQDDVIEDTREAKDFITDLTSDKVQILALVVVALIHANDFFRLFSESTEIMGTKFQIN